MKSNLNNKFKLIKYQDYYNYTYITGQLLSFYFYEMHKKEPDKCEYYIDYFCSNLDSYGPYDLLRKLNVDVEQLSSGETMKRMIKEYNNYYDKFKS
jgi:oligoendopeptidase F